MDDAVWSATTYSDNRERWLAGDVAQPLFHDGRAAEAVRLRSHCSADGTLLEPYARLKSFQPKDGPPDPSNDHSGNPTVNFCGV